MHLSTEIELKYNEQIYITQTHTLDYLHTLPTEAATTMSIPPEEKRLLRNIETF